MGNRVFPPRQPSVGVPLAHGTRDGDMSHGGCLPHFDGLFRLAEEMLDGGELVGGYCECLGAEGVADEEAEILLCMWGFGTGYTKGTRGVPSRGAQYQESGRQGLRQWVEHILCWCCGGTTEWDDARAREGKGGKGVKGEGEEGGNTPSVKGEHLALQTRFMAHTWRLRKGTRE